ncbi:MAG: hypothetical protein NUV97_00240 [archaeon]|nr:hypothetical protein [archaeon]MCR4323606.1 hypothetical protein [Nanoarchaeota archaeon]
MNMNQLVQNIIDKDLSIQKNILRGVLNSRALAVYLIKKYNLKTSLDSVLSAIRRYDSESEKSLKEKNLREIFKAGMIKTRSNIACIVLKKSAPLFEWYSLPEVKTHELKVITGENSTKIILYNSLIDLAKNFFSKKHIISFRDGLSEISLILDPKAIKTKGVLARISGEISLCDVNIEEIVVSPPEFVVYINKIDLVRAHEALFNLQDG